VKILLSALLAFVPCLQDSEPAKKARAELDALRKDIEVLMNFRNRQAELEREFQAAAGDEEKVKALGKKHEAMVQEFQGLRDAAVKRMEGLIASTTEQLKAAPDDPGVLDVRREAYLMYRKPLEALADTQRLAELKPADAEIQERLARLQHGLNRFEAAQETIGKILAKNPKNDEMARLHAMCAFATHKFEQAIKEYDALLKHEDLDPQSRQQAEQIRKLASDSLEPWKAEQEIRAKEAKADDLPRVKLTTSRGEIEAELFENEAPNTVGNFIELVEKKFYDGLTFHRIIPAFMAQGGCPKGNGSGDAGYRFKDELAEGKFRKHFRGSLSMANSGPDTNGSQFFITHIPTAWLNGKHTVFGRVLKGQEVVDALQAGDKIEKAEVLRKREHPYTVEKLK